MFMTLCHLCRARSLMASVKPIVVFVLGGPGAGKGTQCAKIVEEFKFVHLSAGDLLREARASGSPDGQLIETYIKEGKIVPVEITISLLEQAMNKSGSKKFLIDGFPRNRNNLDGWTSKMKDKSDVKFVLFFDCPEETCLERALKRGESSGRTDDNIESFRKRYRTYITSTMEIIEYYETQGLVRKISALPGPEQVYTEVRKLFLDL